MPFWILCKTKAIYSIVNPQHPSTLLHFCSSQKLGIAKALRPFENLWVTSLLWVMMDINVSLPADPWHALWSQICHRSIQSYRRGCPENKPESRKAASSSHWEHALSTKIYFRQKLVSICRGSMEPRSSARRHTDAAACAVSESEVVDHLMLFYAM